MNQHAAIIVGGGPTGLMLAGELAIAGVDVAIVERRESQDVAGLRALGLHMRSIELPDQRGIAERFLSQGKLVRFAPFVGTTVDMSDLPSRHSYLLALWQNQIERTLAEWIGEMCVPMYRGREVIDFKHDDRGVEVELSDGRFLCAEYLVGCDGGRSLIRKKVGIEFPGRGASTSYLIAEVEMDEEPEWGIRRSEHGINAIAKLEGQRARLVLNEGGVVQADEPTLGDVRQALIGLYGRDYGLRSASYISRFTDMARQAAKYRDGRIILAGDAAHVHSPVGGQGLSLGMQDAVNLGWKLAEVIHGTSSAILLDTYHSERHPVGARILRNTIAMGAMERSDDGMAALRDLLSEWIQTDALRKQYVAMMSGLDIRYDFGEGHPLLGRRVPDLDLITANGSLRVFDLLHDARPVLLNFGQQLTVDIRGWGKRIKSVQAKCDGDWELPVIGSVSAPSALLIRPDGHVAWVGDSTERGLVDALITWFGPPVNCKEG